MDTSRTILELESVDVQKLEEEERRRRRQKREEAEERKESERYDGLVFDEIQEAQFTTYRIFFPGVTKLDFAEMVIDSESMLRFKIREPREPWKVYDIPMRDRNKLKETVVDMYQTNRRWEDLGFCYVEESVKTVAIITCSVPLDEDHSECMLLKHIEVRHRRPRSLPHTDKLSRGCLIRSQYKMNPEDIWKKLSRHHGIPWVTGSRKSAKQRLDSHLEKMAKQEQEEHDNTQSEMEF